LSFLGKFLAAHDFVAQGTPVKIMGLNSDNYVPVVALVERREAQPSSTPTASWF
jgi:hypothetical protein